MGITHEGIDGEKWLMEEFRKKGIKVFQPDAISLEKGAYVLNEVKHQEAYEPPPFRGHGLPIWQVQARLDFWRKTGVRARLIVKEKGTGDIYSQWLDVLESGARHDTHGKKPRRIYPLSSFRKRPSVNTRRKRD